ncbi:MAG: hypothetical protein WAM79_19550, partial [Candidatus Sulfotelmatobacter sp.]
ARAYDRALRPAREATKAGQARVKRELLAETNGPYTTSELSYFSSFQLRKAGLLTDVPSETGP